MKIILMGIMLITMKGADMLPYENIETERHGIDVQSLEKHLENEEYEYYDFDTVDTPITTTLFPTSPTPHPTSSALYTTSSTPYITSSTTTESIKQPSQLKVIDETINEERKEVDEDGRRRSARSYIVNSTRRLHMSTRRESPPLPSNSKPNIMKYEAVRTLRIPRYPTTYYAK